MGHRMQEALEVELKSIGLTEVRVDTLAESTNYEPYVLTSRFYEKMGFSVENDYTFEPPDGSAPHDMSTYIKHI